jgi:hypothetical protein
VKSPKFLAQIASAFAAIIMVATSAFAQSGSINPTAIRVKTTGLVASTPSGWGVIKYDSGHFNFLDATGWFNPRSVSPVWGSITGTLSAQTDLQAALNAKQATLVSGTNIKTVGGVTLLGSGDIPLPFWNLTGTSTLTGNVIVTGPTRDLTFTPKSLVVTDNGGGIRFNGTTGGIALAQVPSSGAGGGIFIGDSGSNNGGIFFNDRAQLNFSALTSSGTAGFNFTMDAVGSNSAKFTDATGSPKGIQYNADYSATYTSRSLVDKGWVTTNFGDALIIGQTKTRNPVSDELTELNLDYDFANEQEFTVRTYGSGDATFGTGLQVKTGGGSPVARLYGYDNIGNEGYFSVFNNQDIGAKASDGTNSVTLAMHQNSFGLTGTGSNNSFSLNGFKNANFNLSGAGARFGVVLDNSAGATGFINFEVQNTSSTEPLIIFKTPTNSGIRFFGTGATTGNVIKAKNSIGDSQWGSIDLSLPAAVSTSVLRMVNGGLGTALVDPNANKILAWDDTDNAIGFWTIGAGLSYDHATHTLSSGTANLDTYFEVGTDFTSSWANIVMQSVTFNNGGGLGSSTSSTFGVDATEQASGVYTLSTSNSTAGGSAIIDTSNTHTFGFGFQYEITFRAALETLSDATNTYKVRMGFASTHATQASITDGAYFRYTHGSNSGKWEAVTVSNGVETAQDTGITADVTTYHVFKVTANAAGTSVSFSIDGTVTNTISTNVINSASRLTGRIATIEKTAGAANRNLHIDYVKFITSRTTAR